MEEWRKWVTFLQRLLVLLGHDGGDRAAIHVREMGVVHLVRVCVLGEMGVVAAVIVVVVVFVIVVEAESSNFKGLEKERVFLILGNPGFNGFVALTRYCGFLLFGFEEDEVGLGFRCLRRPRKGLISWVRDCVLGK